jgi:tRNA(Arg) A34 adenosine deaminase TadA
VSGARHAPRRFAVELPGWLDAFLAEWDEPLDDIRSRMELAIALSGENVRRGSGGPFGAIVVEEGSGRLLGAGVNLVTSAGLSIAHAEIIALSVAQAAVGSWNLAQAGHVQLVTSCEPCAMCFGAVPWSGVSSLAWGARKADAERAGFDEGDKPADWAAALERRRITVTGEVLRAEAAAVLAHYAHRDGAIYHPAHGHEEDEHGA